MPVGVDLTEHGKAVRQLAEARRNDGAVNRRYAAARS
jgi:hypothetical protein